MLDKHCLVNNDTIIPLHCNLCVFHVWYRHNSQLFSVKSTVGGIHGYDSCTWSAKSVYFPSKSLNSLTTIDITFSEGNLT